ncbi:MAG: PEGA domain-containing protein [Phycisphaeraceae bacterium]|nr:PEGA domain-containing protein [Phycisphaeraceae bacterium]
MRSLRLIALLLILPAVAGCVQRTISITSQPSGALVYLNDEEVGRTPVTVPFTYYGIYDVRLTADGCQPLWTKQKAVAPWWEVPPVDLAAEAVPHGKAELHWHFDLATATPSEEVDTQQLIDHAEQLKAKMDER